MGAVPAIAAALRAEGGLLADALAQDGALAAAEAPLGALAASGPRASGRREDVAFVVEAVHEGWRLHAQDPEHPPRVVLTPDRDLALLAGDRLYALGLARLAELGDLESVQVLTDVIALSARASAENAPALAHAAFQAGAAGVGWGREAPLEQAFSAALRGDADGAERLRSAARQVCGARA